MNKYSIWARNTFSKIYFLIKFADTFNIHGLSSNTQLKVLNWSRKLILQIIFIHIVILNFLNNIVNFSLSLNRFRLSFNRFLYTCLFKITVFLTCIRNSRWKLQQRPIWFGVKILVLKNRCLENLWLYYKLSILEFNLRL